MSFSQAVYRVRQFWLAWRVQSLAEDELAAARSILTAEQMQLFTRLQPSEQIHALRVLQTVRQWGENDPDLLVAALLHDIGKVRAPLSIWERVVIVLGKALFPERARGWGDGQARGWKRPFVIAAHHPAWGGELAAEVGVSPLAASLIRRHQSPLESKSITSQQDHLLKILQAADHQN